jgi:hypothetical protein
MLASANRKVEVVRKYSDEENTWNNVEAATGGFEEHLCVYSSPNLDRVINSRKV